MKFSSESVKLKSKAHNEDFCFDLETPRGHFFAVLDFGPHDYSNLNATLKGKLETIVGSFVSLSRFSAELFLGFLAKEINNFLHNLGEQSGGPELLASGALCLVNGNRLTYFLCGNVQLNVVNDGRILPLYGPAAESASAIGANAGIQRLGARNQEAPLTDVVQSFTLQDADLVLLMTGGLHDVFAGRKLAKEIAGAGSTDTKVICDALMKSSTSAREDRSLVVVGGPYEKYVDPVLADLSKAVAALESRMEALSENDQSKSSNQIQVEQRIGQQLEVLKDDLKSKAAKIDLLELDERVKNLGKGLLQRPTLEGEPFQANAQRQDMGPQNYVGQQPGISLARVALMVIGAALLGSLIGGWMASGDTKGAAEVWSVKSAGNQITISRLDAEQATVTLNVAQPLNATGEQKFSSFADAKQYIDTVITPSSVSNSPAQTVNSATDENKQIGAVTEVELKQGDTLQEIADRHNIPLQTLMSLNPRITRHTRPFLMLRCHAS
ncbi:MAG: LysM peptidoglycan-binding domain-containing protein [Pyrinomonadaceae bacterium]